MDSSTRLGGINKGKGKTKEMKLEAWLELLPAGLGLFVVVVAAGVLGIFRSLALSKQSYNDTVNSLKTQVEIMKQENDLLKKHIETLERRLGDE